MTKRQTQAITDVGIATGFIAGWFVDDIVLPRSDPKVRHIIQAIGTSSIIKGQKFVREHCPDHSPEIYDSYQQVYEDPEVDVVYIGTPHGFHKQNCLDAIAARKPILCEKPFAINAIQAREVLDAAEINGVYIREAMWLRDRPLVEELQRLLHQEQVIGKVFRAWCDFGLDKDIGSLPADSRYRDTALGAGSLLDIGVYALTWIILALDPKSPAASEVPQILALQSHDQGIEVLSTAIVQYGSSQAHGIATSTSLQWGDANLIARIQGTEGVIEVEGPCPSEPLSFTVYDKPKGNDGGQVVKGSGRKYDFPRLGRGFMYEADNTALDVLAGRMESSVMPWRETMHVRHTRREPFVVCKICANSSVLDL